MKKLWLSFLLLSCGCQEVILHELSESQVNRALIALSKAGIVANKELEGVSWSLKVDKEQANQALAVLEATRLFSVESTQAASSFGLIQSAAEREYSIREQLSKRIEETLKRLPGVLDARVHLFREKRDMLEPVTVESTGSASVLLIVEEGSDISQVAVKDLIAGAVGMSAAAVAVVVTVSKIDAEEVTSDSLRHVTADDVTDKQGFLRDPLGFYLTIITLLTALMAAGIFYLRKRSLVSEVEETDLNLQADAKEVF